MSKQQPGAWVVWCERERVDVDVCSTTHLGVKGEQALPNAQLRGQHFALLVSMGSVQQAVSGSIPFVFGMFVGIAAFLGAAPRFSDETKSENLGLRFSETGKIFGVRKILEDFRRRYFPFGGVKKSHSENLLEIGGRSRFSGKIFRP